MLKWAVTPRPNGEFFEHDGVHQTDSEELLTLQSIIDQQRLPCLVRLVTDDVNDSGDNYCILLSQTNDPYLLVANEAERFSVPVTFDGLFAPVEHGVTRYNVLQTVRSLQSHIKSPTSTSSGFTHFTTLQPCIAYSNSALRRIRPGTILEPCRTPLRCPPSPTPSITSSISSNRIRSLFSNLPHSINKHLLNNNNQSRTVKKQTPPHDYLEVKSLQHDENFCLKSDTNGAFIPVYTQLPSNNMNRRSSILPRPPSFTSSSTNLIQGLYTVELLSQLTHQYPIITELVVSRSLEESVPTSVGYPIRRLTLHRLVEQHRRILAFDMKNYAFLELDTNNSSDVYALEHEDTLFQRYQAQLRWCDSQISSFRSQIKTIVHSSQGTPMFVQVTPLHGQQTQQYYQRRESSSSSTVTSPLTKHVPQTIFTSQESLATVRSRARTPSATRFNSQSKSNPNNKQTKQKSKGQTTGSATTTTTLRKDVRAYFNDPTIQQRLQIPSVVSGKPPTIKQTSFNTKHSNYRTNSTESDSVDDENDDSFQCTAL